MNSESSKANLPEEVEEEALDLQKLMDQEKEG